MFVLTMYIMLLTLDDYKPTWQDRLTTPGNNNKDARRGSASDWLTRTRVVMFQG